MGSLSYPPKNKPESDQKRKAREQAYKYSRILTRYENGDTPENISKTKGMPCIKTIRTWIEQGGPSSPMDARDKKGTRIFTEEVFQEIIRRYSEGETITKICKDPEMPNRSLFYYLLRDRDGWLDLYTNAQDLHLQAHMDKAYELAKEVLDEDGRDPKRVAMWFQIHKFGILRGGPTRYSNVRQDDGSGPVDSINPDYVDCD